MACVPSRVLYEIARDSGVRDRPRKAWASRRTRSAANSAPGRHRRQTTVAASTPPGLVTSASLHSLSTLGHSHLFAHLPRATSVSGRAPHPSMRGRRASELASETRAVVKPHRIRNPSRSHLELHLLCLTNRDGAAEDRAKDPSAGFAFQAGIESGQCKSRNDRRVAGAGDRPTSHRESSAGSASGGTMARGLARYLSTRVGHGSQLQLAELLGFSEHRDRDEPAHRRPAPKDVEGPLGRHAKRQSRHGGGQVRTRLFAGPGAFTFRQAYLAKLTEPGRASHRGDRTQCAVRP